MNKRLFFCLLGMLLIGCNEAHNRLNVFIENSSELHEVITIETFLDNKLVDKRKIEKGKEVINWESFSLTLPSDHDTFKMSVVLPELGYKSECKFSLEQINDKSWMHINFKEVVFKKGYSVPGGILSKDTIVEKGVYCELVQGLRY